MTTPYNLLYVIYAIFSGQISQKCHTTLSCCHVQEYIQDWYIDGKYRIYWQGLETGKRRALASFSICFVPSNINYIFTVNTPLLYLSYNKICKK